MHSMAQDDAARPAHTPGPWAVSKQKSRRVTNTHGVTICNAVLRNAGSAKNGHKQGVKAQLEAEANARLIAASTELLAAAENVLTGLHARIDAAGSSSVPVFAGIAELHAAIQKARG